MLRLKRLYCVDIPKNDGFCSCHLSKPYSQAWRWEERGGCFLRRLIVRASLYKQDNRDQDDHKQSSHGQGTRKGMPLRERGALSPKNLPVRVGMVKGKVTVVSR